VIKKRKYLTRKTDPVSGVLRIYFRKGKVNERLPDDETSKEFAAQYNRLLAATSAAAPKARDPHVRVKRDRDDGRIRYLPPTLGWFIEQYLASKYFDAAHNDAFADGTRYNYRKHLELLKKRLGTGNLVHLDQESVEVYSAEVARDHGPSAGDDQIAMISNLWNFAKGFKEFKRKGRTNPALGITRHYRHDGEGHLAWPETVIEAFDQDCPAHLQFVRMGIQYTGQRGGDVVKMKWTDFDGQRIYVVQEKTGKKLWLNCPKPLLTVLKREQKKTNREFIFHHAYDAPFANAQTLSHAIKNRLRDLSIRPSAETGKKHYVMHGLRKNAGMELALAGCTVPEIMAVLGHKTPKMALYYIEQVQQEDMNQNAVDKWNIAIEKRQAKKVARKRSVIAVVA
jgi:integrase